MSQSIRWWQEKHQHIKNRECKMRELDEQRHLHRAARGFNKKGE